MGRNLKSSAMLVVVGCGGGSGAHPDALHVVDALVVDAPLDAKVFLDAKQFLDAPAGCSASPTYGAVTVGSADEEERSYPTNGTGMFAPYEEVVGVLNADAMPDILFLDLYPGYGAFMGSGNLSTGTFPIAGAELNYATCGICPLIGTNVGSAGGELDDYYAVDGSLTLTSFGSANNGSTGGSGWSGTLSGSINNVHFQHVTIANDGTTIPVDGCTSAIDSMSFSGALVQEPRPAHYQLTVLAHRRYR